MDNKKTYGFGQSTYGFESCVDILGISRNTMLKVIDLNLISYFEEDEEENRQYSGWDIEYLLSARNKPLRINKNEKILVCSMKAQDNNQIKGLEINSTWKKYFEFLNVLKRKLDKDTYHKIMNKQYEITGEWRVKEEDSNFLIENNSIVVASYGGFILGGGKIVNEVNLTDEEKEVFCKKGGRYYIYEPFNEKDKFLYGHCYLASKPGPANKVYSAEELNLDN